MTQPAYPPYQQPMRPMMGAPAQPKPSRGGVTTLVAGLLTLVVAGLAVGGSFGDISTYRNSYEIEGDTSVFARATTWWGLSDEGSTDPSPEDGESLLAGLTLVLAATLLVVGAVFAFMAARTRRPGMVAGMRSLISAGVGVLTGAVLLQLIAVLKQMSTANEQELDAGESLEFAAGLGMWLPLGGLVLGIVAIVLAHVGQQAVRVEPNTPRMGFPAPYGYRPQHMPVAERPTDVQPPGDDATTTQRVSGATASGTFAPVTPPAPAAPITPATTSVPDTQTTEPANKPVLPAGWGSQSVTEKPTDVEPSATSAEPAPPAATPPAEAASQPAGSSSETASPSTASPQAAAQPGPAETSATPPAEPASAAPSTPSHQATAPATAQPAPAEPSATGPAESANASQGTPSPQAAVPATAQSAPAETPATPSAESSPASPQAPAQPSPAEAPATPAAEPASASPTAPSPAGAPAAAPATPAQPGKPGERSALSDFPAAPPAPELSADGDDDGDKSGK